MCGIAGIINPQGTKIKEIKIACDIIRHRGPDDEGYVFFKNHTAHFTALGGRDTPAEVFRSDYSYNPTQQVSTYFDDEAIVVLGHRRLSIVDLSAAGHQPMSYNNDKYWIVFNGEIYNYIEIRKELINKGYKFASNTDTEVVLAAYQEWGIDCFARFNGMWAFAIYDCYTREIILTRDRYGIKPLYYWISPVGSFCFGSEIKQFTGLQGWKAKLNHQRAYDYLFYSLTDHTDETMFRGVFQIPPGCFFKSEVLKIKPTKDQKINYNRWYYPKYNGYTKSFKEAICEFRDLFKSAVEVHLRSDVPVGSALSGGLDSSAIVSHVNFLLNKKGKVELQKTFSSCSKDQRFDEKKWIDEVVKYTLVDAHFVYPKGQDVFKLTEKILWHQDEPYQSQSAFAAYHVFEKAKKENVIVLLNGQGADEYLSGYGAFRLFRHRQYLSKLKLSELFNEKADVGLNEKYLYILKLFYLEFPFSFTRNISYLTKKYRLYKSIFNDDKLKYKKIHPYSLIPFKQNTIFEIAYHQILFEPLQKYLHWEDRNSMAHSVEARVPFLDHRLVEFTTQLPVDYFDGVNEQKKIMRHALKGILPEVIRNRKDKIGFITPEQRWFIEDFPNEFIDYFKENLKYSQGIIHEKNALKYLINVQKGVEEFDYTYWRIILFCVWMKVFNVEI